MKLIGMAAAAALLVSAAMPGGAVAAKKGQAANDPNRQICKSKSVVGSRLKKIRECHSAAEWEDLEMQEQMGLRRQQFNGAPGCPQPPCVSTPGGRDTPW